MSGVHLPPGPRIPPLEDRPTVAPKARGKPSLRWRIRRWILKKLDAWPRERPEPRTEWGRLRRTERERLVRENERLAALEDRLVRWIAYSAATRSSKDLDVIEDVEHFVVEGHLDEMLAEFAEDGDELAAEYLRRGR